MKIGVVIGLLSLVISQNTFANANFLVEQLAKKIVESKAKTDNLTELTDPFFKDHALVLFFSSQCAYCQQFAPVVKQWALAQKAPVLALSFDNQPLPSFPEVRPVTTQWINSAYAGKPITYPALFIANRQHHLLYPIVFGAMGYEELALRFHQVKTKIEAYETGRKSV